MDNQTHSQIVNFIWGIADDCLRDVYVRGKYRDVILPMTVIRRLDIVLERTNAQVLETKRMLDENGVVNQDGPLCAAAGQPFCNSSPFCLKDLAGPSHVPDDVGGVELPALDNHGMGTVFEELVRRFNEANNEEAGIV